MKLKLQPKTYTITAKYAGDKVNPNASTINQVKVNSIILTQDVVKYFKNASVYSVKVIKQDGSVAGAGEKVTFNINGVFYTKTTDANGVATLGIGLLPGDYIVTAIYKDCMVSNKITVKNVMFTDNLDMTYNDGSKFTATLIDGQGKPYANQNITFNVNGVFYNKVTNDEGIASLNIKLMKGEYIITSMYDGFETGNTIKIQ